MAKSASNNMKSEAPAQRSGGGSISLPYLPVLMIVFIDALATGIMLPLGIVFCENVGGAKADIGLMSTAYGVSQLLTSAIVGETIDRAGFLWVWGMTCIGSAVGYGASYLSSTLFFLLCCRVFVGVFKHSTTSLRLLMIKAVPRSDLFGVIAVSDTVSSVGYMMGPIVGGALYEFNRSHIWSTLLAISLFLLNFLIGPSVYYLFQRRTSAAQVENESDSSGASRDAPPAAPAHSSRATSLFAKVAEDVKTISHAKQQLLTYFVWSICSTVASSFLISLPRQFAGVSDGFLYGSLQSAMYVVQILSQMTLASVFPSKAQRASELTFIVVVYAVATVACVSFAGNVMLFSIAMSFSVGGLSFLGALLTTWSTSSFQDDSIGAAFGTMATLDSTSRLICPFLCGWLGDLFGIRIVLASVVLICCSFITFNLNVLKSGRIDDTAVPKPKQQ